ncbi:P-loop containing nucleoside triphosphate hydrolase protein [Aspergillus pseudodeflectus]|uniref:P-loop containing nucleoside triphosphate hydrolase protein n=1 Tax=Aspergillus pseudodeflectus TaxID=176178 RepID=A0ABR4KHU8_9EURO
MAPRSPPCPITVDQSFGPWANSCRGGFDFTLFFEETILAIPLLCIFLLALPLRAWQLSRARSKVKKSPLRNTKLILCFGLIVLEGVQLVLWATSGSSVTRTTATIPTAVLSLTSAIGLSIVSWLEHSRSIRPSYIINIYLFLSVLLDVARARTLWMLGPHSAIPAVFTCCLILKCAMTISESKEKRKILVDDLKEVPKVSTSGPFNHSVFYWLTSLFLHGYKKHLSLQDLYPLSSSLKSEKLGLGLQDAWDRVPDKQRPNVLLLTWFWAYRWKLLPAAIPRLFMTGFTFAQPFLVTSAIRLAASPINEESNNHAYGLIGAYALVYVGIAISTGQYEYLVTRLSVLLRGSITPAVFKHTLQLHLTDTNAEDSLTLINTDLETIGQGIRLLHELWASSLEICLAIWLLARQIGLASLVPVGFALLMMGCGFMIAKPLGKSLADWIQASQKRVTLTSKVLANIKTLRLAGASRPIFSRIEDLRANELHISERYRSLLGHAALFVNCVPIISPILMFAAFVGIAAKTGDGFTILWAFTSLSLLSILNNPLALLLSSLPSLAAIMASFTRIQDYLNRKTRDDSRALEAAANTLAKDTYPGLPTPTGLEMQTINHESESELVAQVRGHVAWSNSTEHAIHIPKWEIQRGTLTLVIGSVGSGKSTLLRCLLGEHSAFTGEICVNTRSVAFCSENPWIPARTVQEVILGEEAFDSSWYGDVVESCALRQDFSGWPQADRTPVGSKGVALSGGQKQRLALARAVYSRRRLLILDNVFSGLDMGTREAVLQKLFGENGLLRQGQITTVLASSQGADSSFADRIAVINKDGVLEEHEASRFNPQGTDTSSPSVSTKEPDNHLQHEPLDEPEDDMIRYTDLGTYKYYFKSAGPVPCLIFIAGTMVFAFCNSFPVLWLKWWSEASEVNPNTQTAKWLSVYIALGVVGIVGFVVEARELLMVIITNSGRYFHTFLVETVSRATMGFYSTTKHGSIINRFSQDLQLMDMELPLNATNASGLLFICIAQCIVLAISSRYVATSFPFLFIVFYIVQRFYLRTSRQMRLLDIEHKAPVYSHFVETLNGLATIRAFGWEAQSTAAMHKVLNDSQRPYYLLFCLQAWLVVVLNLITAILAVIIISVTTSLRQSIGPGYIGVSLTNILGFSAMIRGLVTAWVGLEISIGAITRIRHFTTVTKREGPSYTPVQEDLEWPREGRIEFRNVSGSYGSSENVIRDVSFSIEGGQKIALCGRTGSGKSSLILSLFRMLEITAGQILVDGIAIQTLDPEYVRTRLVAVPQEMVIFEGSVRSNLDPTETLADAEIIQALEKVQLWTLIESKGGLDASINGSSFSQGEQQLLGFARAMLRKSRVLVLDEATSSLDKDTTALVDSLVKEHFAGWTVISILHQLETVTDFDMVAVMDGGRLVEFDQPGALLGEESMFATLYRLHTQQTTS